MKNRFQSAAKESSVHSGALPIILIKSAVIGIFIGIMVLLVAALLFLKTGLSTDYLRLFSYGALGCSGLFCGRCTAQGRGEKRLLWGTLGGVILAFLLYIIGCILTGRVNSLSSALGGILITAFCSALGSLSVLQKRANYKN